MSNADETDRVQLEAPRLDRARRHAQSSIDSLLALGEIVRTEIGSDVRPDEMKEIRFRPNNSKVQFIGPDGGCSYVYEDPPGVCRPCSGSPITE